MTLHYVLIDPDKQVVLDRTITDEMLKRASTGKENSPSYKPAMTVEDMIKVREGLEWAAIRLDPGMLVYVPKPSPLAIALSLLQAAGSEGG